MAQHIDAQGSKHLPRLYQVGLPDLAKRIGAKWSASSAAADAPINQNDAPIVEWPAASQQELVSAICYWDKSGEAPSTLQVCYAQEDLWILEGILRIIETTNQGARANFQAAIKEIEFIRFGSRALEQAGDISSLSGQKGSFGAKSGSPGGMGGSGGPPNLGDERSGMGGMGGMGGGGGNKMGDKAPETDPAGNRYVDDKFVPMDGAKVRSAMSNLTVADAPMFVAKRVPVRLRFKRMDQRRLNEFLAACGSAELVLEVRQVRLNTTAASAPAGGAEVAVLVVSVANSVAWLSVLRVGWGTIMRPRPRQEPTIFRSKFTERSICIILSMRPNSQPYPAKHHLRQSFSQVPSMSMEVPPPQHLRMVDFAQPPPRLNRILPTLRILQPINPTTVSSRPISSIACSNLSFHACT